MKARVIVPLNLRTGTPEVLVNNNTGDRYYTTGDVIDIAEAVIGEKYKDSNIWYRLFDGGFVWSGGVIPSNTQQDYRTAIPNVSSLLFKTNGKGVKIAVLDTGFFLDHKDLLHLKEKTIRKDFGGNNNTEDMQGHGTHILGLLAAKSSEQGGIIGLCYEADFLLYKVIQDDIGFLDSFAASAILDAIENNADIINMSFSVPTKMDSRFHKAIKKAIEKNILVIASAGENENLLQNSLVFPAQFNDVISVGEIDNAFITSLPIKFNQQLDFMLPFIDQISCWFKVEKPYEKLKGSSMATAIISGIIAAILSASNKQTNPVNELKKIASPFSSSTQINSTIKIIKP